MGQVQKIGYYIVYQVSKSRFDSIAKAAFEYALISSAFTINRMRIDNIDRRILNITKGKLAEGLLKDLNEEHKLSLDFERCETPFYSSDKRDFLWRDFEWDLKNNFLTHSQLELGYDELNKLPCLVPDSRNGDQWDKKSKTHFNTDKGVAFLFSFMIGRIVNGPLENEILSVNLSRDQRLFLSSLNEKHKGKSIDKEPFDEAEFWKKWGEIDIPELHKSFEIGFNSPIYFTSMANAADWRKFISKAPSLFANGMMKTRIKNKVALTHELRPIGSILPF